MDNNLILTYNRLNVVLEALATTQQFAEGGRSLTEQLSLVDSALVGLHDARAELVRFREALHQARETERSEADPNNLEGPGRTPEQAAADWRALREVAPTAGDRFKLMFKGPAITEESYHRDPPPGCTCGFMAQVTDPGCPVCK